MNKSKFILIILGIIVITSLSILVMIKSYKNINPKKDNNTSTEIVIGDDNISTNENLTNKLEDELNNENSLSDRFPLLSKYSEKYISVAEWIISELMNEWETNGFTVSIDDETEGYKEVDGLTVYKDVAEYMTYLLNNNADIEDLFFLHCEEKYTALSYTYLLGKDKNNEYDSASSKILYQELLKHYQNKEFETIINKIEELLTNYKFTMPYNYPICHIYQDAKLSLDYKYDLDLLEYGLDYMNTTETYFINFIRLSTKSKMKLVKDNNSLIPDRETLISIDEINDIDLEEYTWITSQFYDYIRNAKSVSEIKYKELNEDDGKYYSCLAYIANNFDRTKIVLTIKWNDDSDCYLYTSKEYEKLYKNTLSTDNQTEPDINSNDNQTEKDIENNDYENINNNTNEPIVTEENITN